jgi:curli production assembly/transport component CsgF
VLIRTAFSFAGACIAFCQPASAQQLVYTPINPSFGGNPFNSSQLLGIANAQNNFKDPSAAANSSPEQQFANQLQSRLLSALSSQIVDTIFGPNAQDHGTIQFGDQTIDWVNSLQGTTLTITNSSTGETTTITVPTTVTITG